MEITYTKPEILNGERSVSVTFTNEDGLVYIRSINVPYDENNVLIETEYDRILEDHLRAVKYKFQIGLISFTTPTVTPTPPPTE